MSMKKYTRATAKGFTLVELIVVIVILGILATIAFLSFSSQSAWARDSKRKTDLSGISSKINVYLAQAGTAKISNIIDSSVTTYTITNPKIAWSWASTSEYSAGKINFGTLGVNASDFKDPLDKDYAIWATTLVGWAFQLASKLETNEAGDAVEGAFFVGNYSPRTTPTSVSVTTSATGITMKYTGTAWMFKVNDYVTNGATKTGRVSSISADQSVYTVTYATADDVPAAIGSDTLILAQWEDPSLIGKSSAAISTTTAPY